MIFSLFLYLYFLIVDKVIYFSLILKQITCNIVLHFNYVKIMKYIPFLFILFLISSCCSKKNNNSEKQNRFSSSIYPNGGTCNLTIIENKGLNLKIINNDTIYEIVDTTEKTIVKYNYSVNQDQAIFDGGYAEEIIFEIENKDYSEILIDENLKNAKVFYRRFCACRGKTGLKLISKGHLDLSNNRGTINLTLDFDCLETPQIIKTIKVVNGKL